MVVKEGVEYKIQVEFKVSCYCTKVDKNTNFFYICLELEWRNFDGFNV